MVQVAGEGHIRIAYKCNVLVDAQFFLPGIADDVHGHVIVEYEDGGGFVLPVEELIQCLAGAFGGEVGIHQEGGIGRQFILFEGFIVSGQSFVFDTEGTGSLQVADGLVSFFDEEFHGFDGAVVEVAAHGMYIGHIGHAVEEYDGYVVAFHLFKMVYLGGVFGNGGQYPIHAVLFHGFQDLFFIFHIVVALADEDDVVIGQCDGFNAIDGGGEEFFPEVGEDDTDGKGFPLFEEDGCLVGFIV